MFKLSKERSRVKGCVAFLISSSPPTSCARRPNLACQRHISHSLRNKNEVTVPSSSPSVAQRKGLGPRGVSNLVGGARKTLSRPAGRLLVSGLDTGITTSELHKTFRSYGMVKEITMSKDFLGLRDGLRTSVQFYDAIDAAKCAALAEMKPLEVRGKPIQVSFLGDASIYNAVRRQVREQGRQRPMRRLWLSNIGLSVTKEDLRAAFKKFGVISELHLVTGGQGISRQFGSIEFAYLKHALLCYETCKHTPLSIGGQDVTVRYMTSQEKFYSLTFEDFRESEKVLRELLEPCEQDILQIRFFYNGGVRTSKGLIYFTSTEAADAALRRLAGRRTPAGRFLKVSRKPYVQLLEPSSAIYISGLPENVTREKFTAAFEKFGECKALLFLKDDGTSKSFGYVLFAKQEDAVKCYQAAQSEPMNFGSGDVDVGYMKHRPWNVLRFRVSRNEEKAPKEMFSRWENDIEKIEFKSHGKGLVHFKSVESAADALANVSGASVYFAEKSDVSEDTGEGVEDRAEGVAGAHEVTDTSEASGPH